MVRLQQYDEILQNGWDYLKTHLCLEWDFATNHSLEHLEQASDLPQNTGNKYQPYMASMPRMLTKCSYDRIHWHANTSLE